MSDSGEASIRITADGAAFLAQLNALVQAAEGQTIAVSAALSDAGALTAEVNRAVERADPEVDADVEADTTGMTAEIERAAERADPTVNVNIDVDAADRAVSGLASTLASITGIRLPVAGFAVLGAAAAAAAGQVAQFAAAVAPAVGITAALPSALGAATGAVSTFQVALIGVGDAFEAAVSGDAEEFAEAIEDLAPSARDAAEALRDITPEFAALREQVQEEFFTGFDQLFLDIADSLGGPLTEGLSASAEAVNGIALAIGGVITSASGVDFIESTFDGIVNAAANLEQPIADLVDGFLQVGDAINDAFGDEDALSGIAGAIQDFADFLSEIAASGEAVQFVEDAIEVFDQLGDILSPIAGIFGSIGEAAQATGGNILGVWGAALQAFDDFLASAEGMDFLISLFETFNAVGSLLADVLAAIAPALIPIVDAVRLVVQAVSPFVVVAAELASLIVQAVMPAVIGLLTIISPIAQLFGDVLVLAVESFMDVLVPLIDFSLELVEAFEPVGQALASQLLPAFAQLTEAIAGPFIEAVEEILPILVESLLPAITELALAFVPLIVEIADLVSQFAERLGPIIADIVENHLVPFIIDTIPALVAGIQIAITWVSNWVDGFITLINIIIDVIDWVTDMIAEFLSLQERVGTALSDFGSTISDIVSDGLSTVMDNIVAWGEDVLAFFADLPGRISASLGDIGGQIWDQISGGLGPFSAEANVAMAPGGTGGASTVNNNVTVNAPASDPRLTGVAVARSLTNASRGSANWEQL